MGDEVGGFGAMYMMTEDGELEPLGDVANCDCELHDDLPCPSFTDGMLEPQELEFVIDSMNRDVLEDVVGKPDGRAHFGSLMVRQVVKVPRSTLLFLRALDAGDDVYRNYMKAVKRSMRNSRARR